MTDEVRNDFIEMIRRAADFCGIKLVAWCIMANHFHILAYLPEPEDIDEVEVLRRFGALKGSIRLADLENRLASMRLVRDGGEDDAQALLLKIKSSMYDIGTFVKIAKQWLTQEYNRRYSHVGTLWEGVYKDVIVKATPEELGKRAGYIHLNPIRAAIVPGFADYLWSSFTALCRGDDVALSGMQHIYGIEASKDEIIEAHQHLMSELLEQIKYEKAMDIARKRMGGFNPPNDPLTNEAMIAQAAAHLEMVMNESIEGRMPQLLEEHKYHQRAKGRPRGGNPDTERQIAELLAKNPTMSAALIADATGKSLSSVYVYLRSIRNRSQDSRKKV